MRRFHLSILFGLSVWLLMAVLENPLLFGGEPSRDALHSLILSGVEKGFHLDQKGAMAELKKAVELDPRDPMPYGFLAMSHLFFYETGFDEKAKKGDEISLLRAVDHARSLAEKKIQQNPQDGNAYFSLALASVVKDRWEMVNKNYLRAFREAQNIWGYLEKTRELSPDNYDVYYPMGVIRYYLSQMSGPARWTASLFITSGDREKGLKDLETAAEKGNLLKDMAQSNLVSVYSGYEKDPARALPVARRLKEKYPENYNFAFGLADILSGMGRFEEARQIAEEIEKGIQSGVSPYRPELQPRYYQLIGRIYLDEGDYNRAGEFLSLAAKDTAPYNNRVRTWALVRLGMVYDARQERKQAEEYYQKALKIPGAEGPAQRVAREYLAEPYIPKKPAQISGRNGP